MSSRVHPSSERSDLDRPPDSPLLRLVRRALLYVAIGLPALPALTLDGQVSLLVAVALLPVCVGLAAADGLADRSGLLWHLGSGARSVLAGASVTLAVFAHALIRLRDDGVAVELAVLILVWPAMVFGLPAAFLAAGRLGGSRLGQRLVLATFAPALAVFPLLCAYAVVQPGLTRSSLVGAAVAAGLTALSGAAMTLVQALVDAVERRLPRWLPAPRSELSAPAASSDQRPPTSERLPVRAR